MALRYPASQSEDDESDNGGGGYVDVNNNANVTTINNNRTPLLAPHKNSFSVNSSSEHLHRDTSDDDMSSASSSSSHSDDEENGGLYINARFSRRSDSGVHSPITDNSSVASSATSRSHVRPIIKLLPDTTLNYGSDEESDNSEFNGYGNAVSHNVNTSRGYDYIYDYNSVYTGDTSSFLPVDSCDIVDVPEGMDLQTAIADDNASTYEFNNAVESKKKHAPKLHKATTNTNRQHGSHMLLYDDDNYSSSSDSEQQFIEDSQYNSSDDEDDEVNDGQAVDDNKDEGLSLRRTLSLGKSGSTNSLCDLSQPPLSLAVSCQQKNPTNFIDRVVPVSYTHLDVYKRQVFYNNLIQNIRHLSLPFFDLFPQSLAEHAHIKGRLKVCFKRFLEVQKKNSDTGCISKHHYLISLFKPQTTLNLL